MRQGSNKLTDTERFAFEYLTQFLKHSIISFQKPVQQVPSAPQGSKLTRRPNTAKSSSSSTNATTTNGNAAAAKKTNASSLAAQRREAQRKQLMELKRKNKLAMSAGEQQQPNQNQVVEIFVNEQSNS